MKGFQKRCDWFGRPSAEVSNEFTQCGTKLPFVKPTRDGSFEPAKVINVFKINGLKKLA